MREPDTSDFEDTIVAISTPPGRGGIGIIRLSGAAARTIAEPLLKLRHPLAPAHARFAEIIDATGETLDEAVVTFFEKTHSYTSEDIVEIAAHGSPVLLDHLLRQCIAAGARLAEPGEFTQRAFISGRLDLTQAEAVNDLIQATTLHQARIASQQLGGSLSRQITPIKQQLIALIAALEAGIDFAEDDIDLLPANQTIAQITDIQAPLATLEKTFAYGRIVRDGFTLAIVGRPNAGKSSLFNLLIDRLRAFQTQLQDAQAERNRISKLIGQAMARKDQAEADKLMAEVQELSQVGIEPSMEIKDELRELLEGLPNLPAADVPLGSDEHDNVEVRRWGEPFAIANPKDHTDLGEGLGLMDFEAASRMSGARFVVLKGELARLERALGQFMLDIQTREHGYTEVSPPLMVRTEAMFGTGQLPKFADDQFVVLPGLDGLEKHRVSVRDLTLDQLEAMPEIRWLIPTAEVSLTNIVMDQIVPPEDLPLRYTALTPSFRAEAGASGRDTRGMIRQHQFYKVELVSIVEPDKSDEEHERMVGCAEAILKRLELPFRTMLLCTGDMGFGARKTYDLEVWLPSEQRYREISSCSNCGDFQARRMKARTKSAGEKGTRFVHTLNGSGLAVGRTLVALMENYQDEDGRIAIPQALHPYLPGLTHIGGKA